MLVQIRFRCKLLELCSIDQTKIQLGLNSEKGEISIENFYFLYS